MEPTCFDVINENIDSLNSATFINMQHLIPIYPIQDLHILAGINVFYFSHASSWYKVFEYFRSRHQYVYYTFPYVVAIPFFIWTVNDFCLLSGNLCKTDRWANSMQVFLRMNNSTPAELSLMFSIFVSWALLCSNGRLEWMTIVFGNIIIHWLGRTYFEWWLNFTKSLYRI